MGVLEWRGENAGTWLGGGQGVSRGSMIHHHFLGDFYPMALTCAWGQREAFFAS